MSFAIKKVAFALLLALVCLVGEAYAQRGGSRSSSRSRSSRRRSSSYWRSKSRTSKKNCTDADGQPIEDCEEEQEGGFGFMGVIAALFFGGIKIFQYFTGIKDDETRKTVHEQVFRDFQAKAQENPSTIDPASRQTLIDQLMSKGYRMVINVRDKSEELRCRISITGLDKVNENKYKINMTGDDEVGRSKLSGLLLFKGDQIAIKLSKVYNNRKKAGQTGSFQNLFYEGQGTPKKMQGRWAFHGYENSMQYAGTWTMVPL